MLYEELLASDVPDDPHVGRELDRYFPTALRQRFRSRLGRHPLRREIVAMLLTNALVNRAGTTFVFRLGEETGAAGADVARAFATAREIFDLPSLWAEIEALDGVVGAQTQIAMLLRGRVLLERATRWLLRNRPRPLDVATEIARFGGAAARLAEDAPQVVSAGPREAAQRTAEELAAAGVPPPLAQRVAYLTALVPVLDLVEIGTATETPFEDVCRVYFAIDDRLELHTVHARISALPRDERWDALARRALWEDLHSEHRALAAEVLRDGPRADPLAFWLERHARPVARWLQVLADAKAGPSSDLATLSVAVREIRNLIDATARARDAPRPAGQIHVATPRGV